MGSQRGPHQGREADGANSKASLQPTPRAPLTVAGPPLGILGQGHVRPTENPGLVTALQLRDHAGLGHRQACGRRQASEGQACSEGMLFYSESINTLLICQNLNLHSSVLKKSYGMFSMSDVEE